MLKITVPAMELFDEISETFVTKKEVELQLEHSLVSLSKWESKWHKAFLGKQERTREETLDYIKCMTLTQNVDPEVYTRLTNNNIAEINAYIENPMTATHFYNAEEHGRVNNEVVTSELIYYWMIALNIPFECQKWHLNRLITLVRVCNIKNQPPKKMGRNELLSRNAALNAVRRKQLGTNG